MVNWMLNGLYLYRASPGLLRTQSPLQYNSHSHIIIQCFHTQRFFYHAPFTHCQHSCQGGFGVQYLPPGPFRMQTGGAGDQTTDLLSTSWATIHEYIKNRNLSRYWSYEADQVSATCVRSWHAVPLSSSVAFILAQQAAKSVFNATAITVFKVLYIKKVSCSDGCK